MSIYTAPDKVTLEKFATDLFAEYKAEVSALGYTVLPDGIVGKRASDGQDVPDAALVTKWIEVPDDAVATAGIDMKEEELPADRVAIAKAKNLNVIKKKEAIPI